MTDIPWLEKYKGEKHSTWKGGRTVTVDGYISIWKPSHPFANKNGRIMEHRLVMEQKIGRYLQKYECVHHLNGIKIDNRIENLKILTNSEHRTLHNIGNKFGVGGKSFLGKHHTEKHKKYMRKIMLGRKFSAKTIEKMRQSAFNRYK
jgi:hypothetical protein